MARPKSDASKKTLEYIKDKINRFDLIPSDSVNNLALSQGIDKSRTPIRKAIQNLEQMELGNKERTKYPVAPITKDDVRDIFIACNVIQKMAIECIMLRNGLSTAEIVNLQKIEEKNRRKAISFIEKHLYHTLNEYTYTLNDQFQLNKLILLKKMK